MEHANWQEHFRSRLDRLPRLDLGVFPTPVRSIQLGSGSIWVKDDGACCDLYGGNKVRKLEYFLADAKRRGTRQLVVWGDPDSHTIMASACWDAAAASTSRPSFFPADSPPRKRPAPAGFGSPGRRSAACPTCSSAACGPAGRPGGAEAR